LQFFTTWKQHIRCIALGEDAITTSLSAVRGKEWEDYIFYIVIKQASKQGMKCVTNHAFLQHHNPSQHIWGGVNVGENMKK